MVVLPLYGLLCRVQSNVVGFHQLLFVSLVRDCLTSTVEPELISMSPQRCPSLLLSIVTKPLLQRRFTSSAETKGNPPEARPPLAWVGLWGLTRLKEEKELED